MDITRGDIVRRKAMYSRMAQFGILRRDYVAVRYAAAAEHTTTISVTPAAVSFSCIWTVLGTSF